MTEVPKIVPKIVYDRLQAAVPEPAHPDADLLTAFAEQSLSGTERDGILEHLALCGDCRDVIALALPAPDVVAAPVANETEGGRAVSRAGAHAPHRRRFSWPSLPWAALAAGVAVAGAVLLLHPGKLNLAILPSANRPIAITVPAASGPQIASSSSSLSSSSSSSFDQSEALAKSEAKTDEAQPNAELRLSRKLKTGQVVKPPLQAASGFLLADNKLAYKKKDSGPADKLSAVPSAGAPAVDASTSRGAAETVEVSGAAAAVAMEPSTENALMARNEAPAIEKAKPALQGVEAQAQENERQKTETAVVPGPAKLQARNVMSAAKLASPASPPLARTITWAITGGVLQRSQDNGQSWQNAVRADHPLLCYANHDDDVWTGGQAGTLFHSADSGATWAQVQPSIKAQALSSDVTHIDLRSRDLRDNARGNLSGNVRGDASAPAEIVISTSNNELWSSADGGRTWKKK